MYKVNYRTEDGIHNTMNGKYIVVMTFKNSGIVAIGAAETELAATMTQFHDYVGNVVEYSVRQTEKSS